MDALITTETMRTEMKALKKGVEVGGSLSLDRDREAKVELSIHICSKASVTHKRWRTSCGT